jgi:geranylgeranyl pyrophosphate synthase
MYYLPLLPLIEHGEKVSQQKICKVFEVYAQEMINLSLGQAMDIAWHRSLANADSIDEKEYLQMCAYKTGTLARMAARIAAVLAGADDELVEKIGHDVMDLSSEFVEKKGGRGLDITEGKRSLAVIHTLKVASAKDAKRLVEILNMHTSDQQLRDEAIRIMEKNGSIEYVRKSARTMVRESWRDVEKLLPASVAKEKLKAFAEFLIERKI